MKKNELSHDNLRNILESKEIATSAPCRIDMGGTLDISTFYYPLRYLNPCTFNIAIGLRTQVHLLPFDKGMVKVSSRGFKNAEYPVDKLPFDHPLGLMFAVAAYFRVEGIHIDIYSASPPRSALGGSSVAAVALTEAFRKLLAPPGSWLLAEGQHTRNRIQQPTAPYRHKSAMLAHAIESSVAGVPCGLQDQLAAAYGGVNAWYWRGEPDGPAFEKQAIVEKESYEDLEKQILVAYCGIPHESKNINQRWVRQFLLGKYRELWVEIAGCTQKFTDAMINRDIKKAVESMNREVIIRRGMTSDVFDEIGEMLVGTAVKNNCGARFTGAGGGGCIWALGEPGNIDKLRGIWKEVLSEREGACLLDVNIDHEGLRIEN